MLVLVLLPITKAPTVLLRAISGHPSGRAHLPSARRGAVPRPILIFRVFRVGSGLACGHVLLEQEKGQTTFRGTPKFMRMLQQVAAC